METVISSKKISTSDFSKMLFDDNDDFYYEILDGEMIRKSAPSPMHQEILKNIMFLLETFIRQHKSGRIFCAPIDVFLDEYNKPQPDVVFVADKNKHIITPDGIMGVPDLIIEIISPTSVIRDRIEKKHLYERTGVPEFWLVDPQNETIEIYTLQNNRYEPFSAANTYEGELRSTIFPGLQVMMNDIFAH